jgi:tRNA (guanine-N7-)-methyltransferase
MGGIMSDQPQHPASGLQKPQGRRPVRTFVRRAGRLTDGQKRALEDLWPRYGVEGSTGPVAPSRWFGNERPVILEIGFGNGDATWRMARAHPEHNFIGVEVHRPGIGRLLLALEQERIDNVRVVCADAVEWLTQSVAPASLDGVRIYFPDPWPKKRHHKRRMIQPEFIELLATRMKAGAILHLATDWAPYAEHMLEVMAAAPGFENLSATGGSCPRPEWRPRTKYEQRGERLGHGVTDLVFRRTRAAR